MGAALGAIAVNEQAVLVAQATADAAAGAVDTARKETATSLDAAAKVAADNLVAA